MQWKPVPIADKILQNVKETALRNNNARLENAYVDDSKTIARFPILEEWVDLGGSNKVFLNDWKGDLIAVSGGRTYRVDNNGVINDSTGVAVTGSGRVIFDKTEYELLMAAGGQIVRLVANKTEILSKEAPESTHVAFAPSGYVIAIEPESGRFYHSTVGQYTQWDALDVFSADGKADNLNACMVTEFGELMLAGTDSIEQFDAAPNGQRPFFRRWSLGSGLYAPYTFVSVDNRVWGINQRKEFSSFTSQAASSESRTIQVVLEEAIDWSGSWAQALAIAGQRFILLQIPNAINPYGTKGLTYLYDYQKDRWSSLYAWDADLDCPTRWKGWSVHEHNNQIYVGGEGKIYKLSGHGDINDSIERMLYRSGHTDFLGGVETRIERLRLRLRRGQVDYNQSRDPVIMLKVNKNNTGFGKVVKRSLGKYGQNDMYIEFTGLGTARTWQFELSITDRCDVQITDMAALVTSMGR